MKLKNKTAIITGANRSIGRAIALAFAKEGAHLVISYRSDEKGAKKVIEHCGEDAQAIHADFSKERGIHDFYNNALEFLEHVDILVNNASGYDTTPLFNLEAEPMNALFHTGVTAPVLLTQLVAKQMIEKKISGSIINISSISGDRPYPNRVAFGASKAALNMVTKTTALDLAPHKIRVNTISPGSTPYEKDDSVVQSIPLQRYGTPEDQAGAALFLASDDSSWMTGQILTIDGGQSLL